MIDPKKLLAFVQRENGVQPMAPPPPMDGDEMMPVVDEDMDDEEMPEDEEEPTPEPEEEEGEAVISEEELEEIVEMVDAGEGDPMLMQYAAELAAEIEEFGDDAEDPPAWAPDVDMWEAAKAVVDPAGKGSSYMAPYAVVAHVYQRIGGTTA